ncbi:GNAT family N-acetyltransferase [Dyadobacter sp. CY312]|uniref:GNAT family N-acetyltransferase n=1 Tax=Dyadobacter sp. CY312 TaxID=2907303 RepID=UPI001F31DD96|nr:GNAT family N-acetyltransferase [Dyadobacter sp. CY312]MCE7044693.1 GNAT family N-acetyltransferase [Dyadobacter sp. CY312]
MKIKDIEITQANVADLAVILALQKLSYQSEAEIYNDYQIQPLTQTLSSVLLEFQSGVILKASKGSTIVGSVRAQIIDGTCQIGKLIVHPAEQNKGLGSALIKKIEDKFKMAKRYELFTGSQSLKNINLYKKLGYILFDTQKINDQFELVFLQKNN